MKRLTNINCFGSRKDLFRTTNPSPKRVLIDFDSEISRLRTAAEEIEFELDLKSLYEKTIQCISEQTLAPIEIDYFCMQMANDLGMVGYAPRDEETYFILKIRSFCFALLRTLLSLQLYHEGRLPYRYVSQNGHSLLIRHDEYMKTIMREIDASKF